MIIDGLNKWLLLKLEDTYVQCMNVYYMYMHGSIVFQTRSIFVKGDRESRIILLDQ